MKKLNFIDGYYVTKDGRIYSDKRGKLKELSCPVDTSGYRRVKIYSGLGKYKTYLVHRLVAMTYLGEDESLKYVNHKDGNKLNNNLDNLEWVNPSDNQKHAFSLGLKSNTGLDNPRTRLTEENIIPLYTRLLFGDSDKELSEAFGVTPMNIRNIKRRKTWEHLTQSLPPISIKKKTIG